MVPNLHFYVAPLSRIQLHSTVELGIKNRQNKNKLGFKNQIVNDRFFM